MFQHVGTPWQILHQDFLDPQTKADRFNPLTNGGIFVNQQMYPGEHFEEIRAARWEKQKEHTAQFRGYDVEPPKNYALKARMGSTNLSGDAWSIWKIVKDAAHKMYKDLRPIYNKLLDYAMFDACRHGKPEEEGEYADLVADLGIGPSPIHSHKENLRRFRILKGVRSIQNYLEHWDADEELEAVDRTLAKLDTIDIKMMQKLKFKDPPPRIASDASELGKALSKEQIAALAGATWPDMRKQYDKKVRGLLKVMDKHTVRPYEDMCRGPVLTAYDEFQDVTNDMLKLLKTTHDVYDQTELSRMATHDVLGLSVPAVGFEPGNSKSGGSPYALYPTFHRKKSGQPRQGVAPSEMDVEYSATADGPADPYLSEDMAKARHDDPWSLNEEYWYPLDPLNIKRSLTSQQLGWIQKLAKKPSAQENASPPLPTRPDEKPIEPTEPVGADFMKKTPITSKAMKEYGSEDLDKAEKVATLTPSMKLVEPDEVMAAMNKTDSEFNKARAKINTTGPFKSAESTKEVVKDEGNPLIIDNNYRAS